MCVITPKIWAAPYISGRVSGSSSRELTHKQGYGAAGFVRSRVFRRLAKQAHPEGRRRPNAGIGGRRMKHFSLEDWADFARGRASADAVMRMQHHLEEGCAECAQSLEVWRAVLEVAGREALFEVPEAGVRCAEALFNIAPPAKTSDVVVQMARLVFSSVSQPVREGVRSAGASTCHLLFEGGNWLLDLHLKPPPVKDGLVSVAGQILDREQTEKACDSSRVTVMRERTEVARTTTNEFGEFQLEFNPGGELMLTVSLEGNSVLVSPLPVSVMASAISSLGDLRN